MIKLFEFAYVIATVVAFFIYYNVFEKNFVKSIFLLIICFLFLLLCILNIKIYILLGFSVAVVIAMIYTVTHLTHESALIMDKAGVDFKSILLTCLVSIFFWPQLLSVNLLSVIGENKK